MISRARGNTFFIEPFPLHDLFLFHVLIDMYKLPAPKLHRPSKIVLCRECKSRFGTLRAIQAHLKLHPDGFDLDEDLYKCPYPPCKHRTIQLANLRNHINTHTKTSHPSEVGMDNATFADGTRAKLPGVKTTFLSKEGGVTSPSNEV